MPYGLISMKDELRLFYRIADFYSRLYPKISFSKSDKTLNPKQIGEVLYTYGGEEIESLAADKMKEVEDSLPDYRVPAIALKKGNQLILLDGHRRLRLAWKKKLPWKVLLLVPDKKQKFGIEKTVLGKLKSLY